MMQRPVPLPLVVVILSVLVLLLQNHPCGGQEQPEDESFPCLTSDGSSSSSSLQEGQFIQEGECMAADEAIWYYDLVGAPIASNGLEAGAPTHFHILFGSLGNPVEDAFDVENYGLYIPGNLGNLTIELSPHFLYNYQDPQPAQGSWTTELGLAPANILFGSPCPLDVDTERGQVVCSGWVSELGVNNPNVIVVLAPDGLYGERAFQVGVKFFHLHPVIELGAPIYYNANGTCLYADNSNDNIDGTTYYCRFPSDCPGYAENNNNTETTTTATATIMCEPALEPLTGSVTATLYDENGNIKHKGTRSYQFDAGPRYHVSETNTRIACNEELFETANFQRVPPNTNVTEVDVEYGEYNVCNHSARGPYAPRFFLFAPNHERTAFPQFPVPNLTATLDDDTRGQLFSGDDNIGTFELFQPSPDAGGKILEENLGFVDNGPKRIGGTLMAVPIRTGSLPGKYTVQVTVIGGITAQSNIIVVDNDDSGGTRSVYSRFHYVCFIICMVLVSMNIV